MAPEPAAVERQLERIFASAAFSSAPKMRALLRYLVEATLAGDHNRLKGYAIGVDVFERGTDFDPGTDPIVRVQAGRLRKLLEAYYHATGFNDAVRMEIPKGSYTVEFVTNDEGGSQVAALVGPSPGTPADLPPAHIGVGRPPFGRLGLLAAAAGFLLLVFFGVRFLVRQDGLVTLEPTAVARREVPVDAISLAVLPFTNMSKDMANTRFGDGLADALITALSRVKSVAIASRTSAFQYREAIDLKKVGSNLGVRYVIEGGLQQESGTLRLNVQLVDTITGAHVWAQEYDLPGGDSLAQQSEIVTTLAAELRPQLFSAYKLAMQSSPGLKASAWQLYMQSTWVPGEGRNSLAWEKERIALARKALELDPDLGQAHSVLAEKLSEIATIDPPSDTEAARKEAAFHARRAIDLAPTDADVRFNVSAHYWFSGRIPEAIDAIQRTLELDPNHVLARFLVKVGVYTCSRAPRHVIDELQAFDTKLSPDNPARWVTLTWVSSLHLNNGDFSLALDAARRADQISRTPNSVYRHAAILLQTGDAKTAVAEVSHMYDAWPNLDPRHYADVTIRRRCEGAPGADFLHRVYSELADAVKAARRGG